MLYICNRFIDGNRGDLLSRYGILNALEKLNLNKNIIVVALKKEHLIDLDYSIIKYGVLFNVFPNLKQIKLFLKAKVILWTGGIDLSDDSSKIKLLYIFFCFLTYRIFGLKILVLNQGAGPVTTKTGFFLSKIILKLVSLFIARDKETYSLIKKINPTLKIELAYDGIFSTNFNLLLNSSNQPKINDKNVLIGFNIRQWYHFNNSFLPKFLNPQKYNLRSNENMNKLIDSSVKTIEYLLKEFDSQIILISNYELLKNNTDSEFAFLKKIKKHFTTNERVILIKEDIDLIDYLKTIKSLNLMIGTRLHSSLIAINLGIPTININYTLKGRAILNDMELADLIIEMDDFIKDYSIILNKVNHFLFNIELQKRIISVNQKAYIHNFSLYKNIFSTI